MGLAVWGSRLGEIRGCLVMLCDAYDMDSGDEEDEGGHFYNDHEQCFGREHAHVDGHGWSAGGADDQGGDDDAVYMLITRDD